MFSGYLDKLVTVTTVERVFDGRGGYTNREVVLGEFYAAIHPLGISEQIQYSQLDTDVSVKMYMRYHPDFKKGMKIGYRGKMYEVKGVINSAFQDEFIELVVNEV